MTEYAEREEQPGRDVERWKACRLWPRAIYNRVNICEEIELEHEGRALRKRIESGCNYGDYDDPLNLMRPKTGGQVLCLKEYSENLNYEVQRYN